MNIEGFSVKTLEQLYDKFNLKTFSDIYKLTAENFAELEGFKEKKINNALNSIENSKNVKLANFIYALGIDGVGIKTAKQLAKIYKSIKNLQSTTIDELIKIDDIAEIMATDIYSFFNDEFNLKELIELYSIINIEEENTVSVDSNGYFAGKKVVLTGTLTKFSRSEAEKFIEAQGGITSSSVTGATSIVLVGENPGSKYEKAKKLGIQIMFEDEFLKHINN